MAIVIQLLSATDSARTLRTVVHLLHRHSLLSIAFLLVLQFDEKLCHFGNKH